MQADRALLNRMLAGDVDAFEEHIVDVIRTMMEDRGMIEKEAEPLTDRQAAHAIIAKGQDLGLMLATLPPIAFVETAGKVLDLNAMLAADDESFLHDLSGIRLKWNPKEGRFRDGFRPRTQDLSPMPAAPEDMALLNEFQSEAQKRISDLEGELLAFKGQVRTLKAEKKIAEETEIRRANEEKMRYKEFDQLNKRLEARIAELEGLLKLASPYSTARISTIERESP